MFRLFICKVECFYPGSVFFYFRKEGTLKTGGRCDINGFYVTRMDPFKATNWSYVRVMNTQYGACGCNYDIVFAFYHILINTLVHKCLHDFFYNVFLIERKFALEHKRFFARHQNIGTSGNVLIAYVINGYMFIEII